MTQNLIKTLEIQGNISKAKMAATYPRWLKERLWNGVLPSGSPRAEEELVKRFGVPALSSVRLANACANAHHALLHQSCPRCTSLYVSQRDIMKRNGKRRIWSMNAMAMLPNEIFFQIVWNIALRYYDSVLLFWYLFRIWIFLLYLKSNFGFCARKFKHFKYNVGNYSREFKVVKS